VSGVLTVAAIALVALWLLRPWYLKYKQRRKFRQFEAEQRRKWEQHRRE
jgi:hypothetical protein